VPRAACGGGVVTILDQTEQACPLLRAAAALSSFAWVAALAARRVLGFVQQFDIDERRDGGGKLNACLFVPGCQSHRNHSLA
jgi:hypothetical protein